MPDSVDNPAIALRRAILRACSPFATRVDPPDEATASQVIEHAQSLGVAATFAVHGGPSWRRIDGLSRSLRRIHLAGVGRIAALAPLRARVVEMAAQLGIRVALMKGALFESALYAAGARVFSDIDILVDKRAVKLLHHRLLEDGFTRVEAPGRPVSVERQFEWTYLTPQPERMMLDVHRAPCEPDYFRVDVDGWLDRASSWPSRAGALPGLCAEDALLHLALHAASHGFELSFRTFLDGAWLLHTLRVDIGAVVAQARAMGAHIPLWLYLSVIAELFDVPGLDDTIAALGPGGWRERHLRALIPWRETRLAQFDDDNRARIIRGIFPLLPDTRRALAFMITWTRRRAGDVRSRGAHASEHVGMDGRPVR